jgi:hypothetical protein
MRYIVCDNSENKPFYTDKFEMINFSEEDEMIIFDLVMKKFTIDGKNWEDIGKDDL